MSLSRRHVSTNHLGRYEIVNPYPYDLRARAATLPLTIEQGATFYRQFNWKRSDDTFGQENRAMTGPDLTTDIYKWTLSTVANHYYVTLANGSNPSLTEADVAPCIILGELATVGTNPLTAGQCLFGNLDSLGFNTLYIYSTTDPDSYRDFGVLGTDPSVGIRFTVKLKYDSTTAIFDYELDSGISFINSDYPGYDGMFAIRIDAATTTALSFTNAYYTLEVYELTGTNVYRLAEGKIILSKEAANVVPT